MPDFDLKPTRRCVLIAGAGAGVAITYITDPWGTRVELVQFGLQLIDLAPCEQRVIHVDLAMSKARPMRAGQLFCAGYHRHMNLSFLACKEVDLYLRRRLPCRRRRHGTDIHECLGNTGLLRCRGGRRDLAAHKIAGIRPPGVRPPCTRHPRRLFLGPVAGPDPNTDGCGIRDLVRGRHRALCCRLAFLSATLNRHATVHRVGRRRCHWPEPIDRSGLGGYA
jgi:hypothetical protein